MFESLQNDFDFFVKRIATVICAHPLLPPPTPPPPPPARNASSSARRDALAPSADESPAPGPGPDHTHTDMLLLLTNHRKSTIKSASVKRKGVFSNLKQLRIVFQGLHLLSSSSVIILCCCTITDVSVKIKIHSFIRFKLVASTHAKWHFKYFIYSK